MIRWIVLTGPSGAGKSVLSRLLAAKGWRVIEADALARSLYARGKPGYKAIVSEFGAEVVGRNGQIDRLKLGGLVFKNPRALRRLDRVLMPRLVSALRALRARSRRKTLVDMAVFFKSKAKGLGDQVVLVDAPLKLRLERIMRRSPGKSRAQALAQARSLSFGPRERKAADLLIRNSGSPGDMLNRFEGWLKTLGD